MMLVEYLNKTFGERRAKNPSYSLRAFARSLEMDSSTLSAILRSKRPLSAKAAQKIIDALDFIDPMEAQMLVVETITKHEISDESLNYKDMAMSAAETIASWQHFAILAFLELHNVVGIETEISKKLNIPLKLVVESMARLEKLELVARIHGEWKLTGKNMATRAPVANQALREGHRQNIMKSLESLEKHSIEERDISGITMAISKSRLPQAKRLIQDFRRRMSAFLEEGNKNAVYRLNIQLFPLTEKIKDDDSNNIKQQVIE